ncbi:MAG: hypothetical protein RLP44_32035 [Aggregatilineales bacterium]
MGRRLGTATPSDTLALDELVALEAEGLKPETMSLDHSVSSCKTERTSLWRINST